MNEIKHISSAQNPLIKKILLLKEKSRERKKSELFILEGARELQMALKGNYRIQNLLFCPEIIEEHEVLESVEGKSVIEVIAITKLVYQKIAHRATTEGIVAIAQSKSHPLGALTFKNANPLILVAEAPEKPGNIGALLRTADAANLDAVIIANAKGDLYNPNIIRSSVGSIFTTTIALGTTSEIISFLKEHNIAIYGAALTASERYTQIDFKTSAAIVVGTEATGLSKEWLQNTAKNIIIPMLGEIDSMNVSVSAAILIFEAKRQRNFN